MNTNQIVDLSTLRTYQNPFQRTLSLVQDRLNSNLPDGCRRIWVEGSNKSAVTLCITVFPNRGEYRFIFHTIKNFRNVKEGMEDGVINDIISDYEDLIRVLI